MNGGAAKKMKIEPVAEPFSTSRIRFGDVMFTDSYNITRRDVSLNQITTQRIRAGSRIYKVIANDEIIESPINQIGDYDHVDILFDNTDPFKTSE